MVFRGIPGHVHKQLDGVFHGLQVAHIQDPQFLDTTIVGQLQLLPHVLDGGDVDPFRVTGCSDVVHVVVESPATLALLFLSGRQTAHVAPVVVAEQYRHIVRHAQSCVVVVLYFFIECPYLWGLVCRFPRHLLDDATLVVDDALQEFRVRTVAHGLVTVATHADGHDIVSTLHALDTLTEETVQILLVRAVVPGAPALAVTGILLMVAGHGLVVRGTHHHTHGVGGLQVLRVVGIESPAPHGGPQVVALQPEDQLKHLLIELMTSEVGAEGVLHPRRQTGCLVVEEQATVSDSRLSVCIFAFLDI